MSLAADKTAARKAAAARRKAAHAQHRTALAEALAGHLAGLSGHVIAGYLPIRTEADPLPAMTALHGANRIAVPVIAAPATPLEFREWHPGAVLTPGAFGVLIPEGGAALVPDVLIVPLLAFDGGLFRLGYGGGFYDRTLAALRAGGTVRAIGLAYAAQRATALPLEPTDLPLDEIVTEEGVLRGERDQARGQSRG